MDQVKQEAVRGYQEQRLAIVESIRSLECCYRYYDKALSDYKDQLGLIDYYIMMLCGVDEINYMELEY